MRLQLITLCFIAQCAISYGHASVPNDVKNLINSLPDKAITLELVLARAAQRSDSIKAVRSQEPLIPLAQLLSQAELETRIVFSTSKLNDATKPPNPFSPSSTKATQYGVGVFKAFSTGTDVSLELNQSHSDIGFPSGSLFTIYPYYESKGSLSIRQSLWSNAFGYGTKRQLESANLQTEARKLQYQESLEGWALNFIQLYYEAWLSQKEAQSAELSLKRRQRLRQTVNVNRQRGTAEESDFLQVDSAYILNQNRTERAVQKLQDNWRRLVFTLKMPEVWVDIDPLHVPIKLDSVYSEAIGLCEKYKKENVPLTDTLAVRTQEILQTSAQLELEKSRNQLRPQVELQGRYFFNGLDESRSRSFSDAQSLDNDAWSLGLSLVIPLEFNIEKAALAQSVAKKSQAEAALSQARDEQRIRWLNECFNLSRLNKSLENMKKTLENQTKRLALEERRFQLGRTSVFNVIQAGDDLTEADLLAQVNEVELRLSSWRVLSLNALISKKVEDIIESQSAMAGKL